MLKGRITKPTVAHLRKLLDMYPDDAEVYLSTDEEGNNFHHLCPNLEFVPKSDSLGTSKSSVILYPNQHA